MNITLRSLPARSRRVAHCAAATATLALAACGGGGGGAAPGNGGGSALRVSVAPASVTLDAGATQQFTASIDGAASTEVRFELASGVGSVDAAGLFRAPTNVSAAVTAVVRAIALADARATATATVTVQPSAVGAQFGLGVRLGVAGGFDSGAHLRERAGFAADAVFQATRLAGRAQPVTRGTLRIVAGALAFDATPTDRLVVDLGADGRSELFISQFSGDLSNGAGRFLARVHTLALRAVGTDLDVQLTDARAGDRVLRTLRGSVPLLGQSAQVDISEDETIDAEITPGVDFHAVTALTGSIDVAGVHVDLDETLDTRIVIATRAVEQFKRFQRNRWNIGQQRFALRDVRIFSLFVDARGDEFDFWRGEGQVEQNGQVVGQLESAFETNDFVVRLRLGAQVFEARRIPVFVR